MIFIYLLVEKEKKRIFKVQEMGRSKTAGVTGKKQAALEPAAWV